MRLKKVVKQGIETNTKEVGNPKTEGDSAAHARAGSGCGRGAGVGVAPARPGEALAVLAPDPGGLLNLAWLVYEAERRIWCRIMA